ncbi:hypothetical protein [Halobacteriovorax sp. DPLXC-1]|uniref:hypothetical protein n=1 Tax=Halobacteriovorax sp. DPLXC-1 TaxID=3110771 RepID=UPI002FF2B044
MYNESYGFKPLINYKNSSLYSYIIKNRKWYQDGLVNEVIFVLREVPNIKQLEDNIKNEFPNAKLAKVSDLTKGALNSALVGVSMIRNFENIVCIDLIDIDYKYDQCIVDNMVLNNYSGFLLSFESDLSTYSYLKVEVDKVVKTQEKQVISNEASAGTYFYRNVNMFLKSVDYSIKNFQVINFKSNLFVCPSFNGIINELDGVGFDRVVDVTSLSKDFH